MTLAVSRYRGKKDSSLRCRRTWSRRRGLLFSGALLAILLRTALAAETPAATGGAPAGAQTAGAIDDDEDAESPIVATPAAEQKANAAGQPTPPVPLAQKPPGVVTATEKPDLSWGIPPISWRGSYGASYTYSMASEAEPSTTLAQSLSLSGSSYVYQPWFATVTGGMNVSLQNSHSGASTSTGSGRGFSLGANVLPRTRFNSAIGLTQSENTATSSGVSTTYSTTGLTLQQTYSPPTGAFRSNTRLDHNSINSGPSGSDTIDALAVSVAVPLATENPQSLSFNGGFSNNRTSRAAGGSSFSNFAASHSIYLEDYVFTLNSDLTYTGNDFRQPATTAQSTLLQAGSAFDWLPSDDYPITLRGGLRALSSSTATTQVATPTVAANSQESKITSYFGNVQAAYPINKNWNLNGGVNAVSTGATTGGAETKTSIIALTMNAGWTGDGYRTKLGAFDYNLNYGAGAGVSWNKTDLAAATVSTTTGSVGHNFGRTVEVSSRPMTLGFGQSVSVSKSSNSSLSTGLSHTASMGWGLVSGPNSSLTSSAQFSDARSFGVTNSYQQSINASLFGNRLLTAFSTLGSNVAVGFTRQGVSAGTTTGNNTQGSDTGAWRGYGAGSVIYSNMRFADVSGLNYTFTYQMNIRQSAQRSLGDASATPYDVDHQINQKWNWRLGLLGWQIDNTFSYVGSTLSGSISLSITRDFGGML